MRSPCCDKESVKKGTWSAEEDAILIAYAEKHPVVTNWIALPKKIGLNRCGKSCRLRWLNYLRPDIKHGKFTEEEDRIICKYYFTYGSRWSKIAEKLSGRTDNDIKNYWNTKLKRKYVDNKKKYRPRHSFKGIINDVGPNNVFTITHGDVMSTSWPSTSQLLKHVHDPPLPPPPPPPLVEDPFCMLMRSIDAISDVSPSQADLKELENLLFEDEEGEGEGEGEGSGSGSRGVMEGPDQIGGHTNGVVCGPGDLNGGDVVVICGETVASWDVDVTNLNSSLPCLNATNDINYYYYYSSMLS